MTQGYVYIGGNPTHTTLYVGVTTDFHKIFNEHQHRITEEFSHKHTITHLYYYRFFESIDLAITEEKRIKEMSKSDINALVMSMNPLWKNLQEEVTSFAASLVTGKEGLIIHENYPIGDKFTWRVETTARWYVEITGESAIQKLIKSNEFKSAKKHYILGNGANTLFASSFYDGMVIAMRTKTLDKVNEDELFEYWKVAAGLDWVSLVDHMVMERNLGGLENLAYIPGRVGSAPIQNIAAYGSTFEDVCDSVDIVDLNTGTHETYTKKQCAFDYRTSIFKRMIQKGDATFLVWSVTFKLSKPSYHAIESGYFSNYESLSSELVHLHGERPSIQDMYKAVVSMRKKKLPEITDCGTNGSLFINPIVSGTLLKDLLVKYPQLQYYPSKRMQYVPKEKLEIKNDAQFKIAAGHIFDEIGWKGKRVGNVGTWKNHALVLCNYGTNSPEDILNVITMMQKDFENATGIHLEPEINIVR